MQQLLNGPNTPSFFQSLMWAIRPLETLDYRAKRYGSNFRIFKNQYPPTLYFSSPDALKTIFTAPVDRIDCADRSKIFKPFVGEKALIVLSGTYHQKKRQLLMPPLHATQMRSFGQVICSVTQQIINRQSCEKPFVVRDVAQKITLNVMLQVVFGLPEQDKRFEQLNQLFLLLIELFSSPFTAFLLFFPQLQKNLSGFTSWQRFLKLKQQIDALLVAEIHKRRNQLNKNYQDILSLLLEARDESGQLLSDDEIKDELLTLLLAGYENTASALAWSLYSVNSLPLVKEQLLTELNTISSDWQPEEINRLPFLNATCKETLRLYPITLSAFPRIVKQPIDVIGYHLEPGTTLIPSIYLAHQREDTYPNPKQFRPERFLERQFSPYEYLPFGGGNHHCIGDTFALYEMKLALATIMSQFQVKIVGNKTIKPVRRGLTLSPSKDLCLAITGIN